MKMIVFDNDKKAMINPSKFVKKREDMPETLITFFDYKLLDEFLKCFQTEIIDYTYTACKEHPIYKINYKGKDFAVVQAGVGAPYCMILFEELIEMGVKNILMFGSCGCLVDLKFTSIIIPTSAVREEGASYHYAEASDEIQLDSKYVNRLIDFCKKNNLQYTTGKTWTTDGFYRETKRKVEEKVKKGCISVEMECSAMAALAKFRNVNFSQFFYVTDCLAKEDYDEGILSSDKLNGEEKLLHIAFDCALNLFD